MLRRNRRSVTDFATFVANRQRGGPQTVELIVASAQQAKGGQGTRETWYRRMAELRPFLRYLSTAKMQAVIQAPPSTWIGQRDLELLQLPYNTDTLGAGA